MDGLLPLDICRAPLPTNLLTQLRKVVDLWCVVWVGRGPQVRTRFALENIATATGQNIPTHRRRAPDPHTLANSRPTTRVHLVVCQAKAHGGPAKVHIAKAKFNGLTMSLNSASVLGVQHHQWRPRLLLSLTHLRQFIYGDTLHCKVLGSLGAIVQFPAQLLPTSRGSPALSWSHWQPWLNMLVGHGVPAIHNWGEAGGLQGHR